MMVNDTRPMRTTTSEISQTRTAVGGNTTTISTEASTTTAAATVKSALATNGRLNKQRRLFFKARNTKFDITDPDAHKETFRGFYTLFWLAMIIYSIQTFMACYQQEGILLSLNFYNLISEDALALLVSDFVMVSLTLLCVPYSKLLVKGVLRYETTGIWIQHVCQVVFICCSVYWVFWR